MRSKATGMLRKNALGTQGGVVLLHGQAHIIHKDVSTLLLYASERPGRWMLVQDATRKSLLTHACWLTSGSFMAAASPLKGVLAPGVAKLGREVPVADARRAERDRGHRRHRAAAALDVGGVAEPLDGLVRLRVHVLDPVGQRPAGTAHNPLDTLTYPSWWRVLCV